MFLFAGAAARGAGAVNMAAIARHSSLDISLVFLSQIRYCSELEWDGVFGRDWVGLGGTTGTGPQWPALGTVLWPPSISLRTAPSHQAGLFQRKVSLHRRGRNTSTGATLTVFIQYSSFTVFIQYSSFTASTSAAQLTASLKRGLYIVRRPINLITRNEYSYASTPVTIIPTLMWCPQREP